MEWSEERIGALKNLFAQGLPASAIAAELGGVTRNAVIGKVSRLGLSRIKLRAAAKPRAVRADRPPRLVPARTPKAMIVAEKAAAKRREAFALEATEATDLTPEEIAATAVRLVDHNEGQCRWPSGDPSSEDFRYCGAVAVGSLPYCGRHCHIAYKPPAARRDRRRA